MKYLSLIVVCFIFCIVSCKKKNNSWSLPVYYADTAGPAITIDSFPLREGNRWVYKYDLGERTLTVQGDTIIDSKHCTKVIIESPNMSTGIEYLYNAPDGLHEVAFDIDTSVNKAPVGAFLFAPYFYKHYTLFSPDAYTAKFPACTGGKWATNEFAGAEKVWVSYGTVTNKAGSFNCIKMAVLSDGNDGMTYYYYSSKGLVRFVIVQFDDLNPTLVHVNTQDLISTNL